MTMVVVSSGDDFSLTKTSAYQIFILRLGYEALDQTFALRLKMANNSLLATR